MKFGAIIAKWVKGVATAFSELTKVQMAIVGTTAAVAKKLNRNYLGYEIVPDYINISNERLSKIKVREGLYDKIK